MARKIVFTNALGQTLTFDGNPFLISKIDGLGTPETNIQEQKAPYQDGTTYIDALLNNRDVSVEIAITTPNDFTDIDTHRRTLAQRLNPKLGQGSLIYTTEGGQQYKLNCIPLSSPNFSNKDYQDPYARAMVTFHCNDPYWLKTTSTTANIGLLLDSGEQTINNVVVYGPSLIQQSDGSFRIAYFRSSDLYLVQQTSEDGINWSSVSVITGVASTNISCCLIQESSGAFRIIYTLSSGYLVQKTSTDGITWSSESTINSANSAGSIVQIIQLASGGYKVIYKPTSTNYLVQRTSADGSTWGGEANISLGVISGSISIIQLHNGSFIAFYVRGSDSYLVQRTSADGSTWGGEIVVSTVQTYRLQVIQALDYSLNLLYKKAATSDYFRRISYDFINWSNLYHITNTNNQPSFIQQSNGVYRIAYANIASSILVNQFGDGSTTINNGDVQTPCAIRFDGPAINPRIENLTDSNYISLTKTLAAGDYFIVDTSFGNKTIKLYTQGIESNGIAYLDLGSTFFQLGLGDTALAYSDETTTGTTATATVTYTERYVGV